MSNLTQQEVREMWVDALLNGGYEQGTGFLRTADNCFCCLGVLCDLAVKNGVIPEPKFLEDKQSFSFGVVKNSWSDTGEAYKILPEEVKVWAGLSKSNGDYYAKDEFDSSTLASKNDNGYSFTQIAEIIQSKPEGLFAEE